MTSAAIAAGSPVRVAASRFTAPVLWFLLGLAFILTLTRYRLLPDIFLLTCLFFWFLNPRIRRPSILALSLGVFLLMETLLPFDLSILYGSGQPRVVRLVMGYPAPSTLQKARRGEVVWGGCTVTGNEPRWILIW